MRAEIVRELLLKLERALRSDAKSIEVNVQGSREIVRDPTFPLPAPTASPGPARAPSRGGRTVRGRAPTRSRTLSPAGVKRAKAGQPRPAKAEPSGRPAAKAKRAGKQPAKAKAQHSGPTKSTPKPASRAVSSKRKKKPAGV
jgi:hypothetical protein